jgi:predicted enzyme related to lactoylglutathione lyase
MPRVTHFGIHASDAERAIQFYTRVFGWQFVKWEDPIDYWTIKTGPEEEPGIDGGLTLRKAAAKGEDVISYINTINVPSLDEYLKKVLENGGHQTVATMPIPNIGWLAYCKDTEGNIFGMMQEDASAS